MTRIRSAYQPIYAGSEDELDTLRDVANAAFVPAGKQIMPAPGTLSKTTSGFIRRPSTHMESIRPGHESMRTLVLTREHPSDKFGILLTRVGTSIIVLKVRPGTMGARAGFTFGDQICSINGVDVAGTSAREVAREVIESPSCTMVVRRKPHIHAHRVCLYDTLGQKGSVGLTIKDGAVSHVRWGGPAAKASLHIDQVIVAVNGVVVIALPDKDIKRRIRETPGGVAIVEVMNREIFQEYVKGVRSVVELQGSQ